MVELYCLYIRLQWTSRDANVPVVYYGQTSGYYDHVRVVRNHNSFTVVAICQSHILIHILSLSL